VTQARAQADAELAFTPYYTKQESAVAFQFAEKDGNKRKLVYFARIWKGIVSINGMVTSHVHC